MQQPLTERSGSSMLMECLRAIFELFGMDSEAFTQNMSGVSEQDVVKHPVFQSEMRSKGIDYDGSYTKRHAIPRDTQDVSRKSDEPDPIAAARSGLETGVFANDDTADAAFRAAVSIGIERHAEQSVARGVGYRMGGKGDGMAVDCSGFVDTAVKKTMHSTLPESSRDLTRIFSNHSDGQISGLARKTGAMLAGQDVNMSTLKAGMVIGIDSGDKGWDRGRNLGVDHVGIVYADSETGKLMFAESRSRVGVDVTPLEEKLDYYNSKGWKLYASDIVELASDEQKQAVAAKIQQNSDLDQTVVAKVDDYDKPEGAKPEDTSTFAPPAA